MGPSDGALRDVPGPFPYQPAGPPTGRKRSLTLRLAYGPGIPPPVLPVKRLLLWAAFALVFWAVLWGLSRMLRWWDGKERR